MKKVSIIIPVYNCEKYIKRCIISCLNQTYPDIELVIVNDGSTDQSEEIIKKFSDKRIKYFFKKNSGVSDSRNYGLKKSTGFYIMFADADDWLEKNAVEIMVNNIEEKGLDAIRANYRIAKEKSNGKITFKYNKKTFTKKSIEIKDVLIGKVYCYVWLLIIKKESIGDNILFDKSLAMMEDNDFYIQLILNNLKIGTTTRITYNYYVNKKSASLSTNNFLRNGKNILILREKTEEKLKKYNQYTKENIIYNNTNIFKLISLILKDLYKSNKQEFDVFFEEIYTNSLNWLLKVDINKLNILQKITYLSLKKHNKDCLTSYLNMRNFIIKIKEKIR